MQSHALLTVYGRSFGVAPVLGMLGALTSFDELERSVAPWTSAMSELAEAPVMVTPHLIYGLARPCSGCRTTRVWSSLTRPAWTSSRTTSSPAADRGMGVVLDTQLGRLAPTYFVQRMIDAGYLAYPNVHVALDPEFATQPGQDLPGDPIGTLSAASINQVQAALAAYVREEGLSHKKVLIVHQFIDDLSDSRGRWCRASRTSRFIRKSSWSSTPTALDPPTAKVRNYNAITDPTAYPQLRWRGIKIFQHNPHAPRFSDSPVDDAAPDLRPRPHAVRSAHVGAAAPDRPLVAERRPAGCIHGAARCMSEPSGRTRGLPGC